MKFRMHGEIHPLSVYVQISVITVVDSIYMYYAYIAPLLSLVSAAAQFVSQYLPVMQVGVIVPPLSPPPGPEGCERTALPSEAHL